MIAAPRHGLYFARGLILLLLVGKRRRHGRRRRREMLLRAAHDRWRVRAGSRIHWPGCAERVTAHGARDAEAPEEYFIDVAFHGSRALISLVDIVVDGAANHLFHFRR